jgi:hypothetical protein
VLFWESQKVTPNGFGYVVYLTQERFAGLPVQHQALGLRCAVACGEVEHTEALHLRNNHWTIAPNDRSSEQNALLLSCCFSTLHRAVL